MELQSTFIKEDKENVPSPPKGVRRLLGGMGKIIDLGLQPYDLVHALQLKAHAAVALKEGPETVIFTEHEPVYTCGRTTKQHERPVRSAIPTIDIERGGGLTYHGPGQIVGYPILNLAARRLSIPQYLRTLEKSLMEVLTEIGVEAHYKEEYRAGLWVGEKKIVSIGIAVRRWVTFHGFAFNVDCDLTPFYNVSPCGLTGDRITSLKELGITVDKLELTKNIQRKLLKAFF